MAPASGRTASCLTQFRGVTASVQSLEYRRWRLLSEFGSCCSCKFLRRKMFAAKCTFARAQADLQLQTCTQQRQHYFRSCKKRKVDLLRQNQLCSDKNQLLQRQNQFLQRQSILRRQKKKNNTFAATKSTLQRQKSTFVATKFNFCGDRINFVLTINFAATKSTLHRQTYSRLRRQIFCSCEKSRF